MKGEGGYEYLSRSKSRGDCRKWSFILEWRKVRRMRVKSDCRKFKRSFSTWTKWLLINRSALTTSGCFLMWTKIHKRTMDRTSPITDRNNKKRKQENKSAKRGYGMRVLWNLSIYRKLLVMIIISTISQWLAIFTHSELPTAQHLCIMTACSLSGS